VTSCLIKLMILLSIIGCGKILDKNVLYFSGIFLQILEFFVFIFLVKVDPMISLIRKLEIGLIKL
jgi:hypothetical protein